ncbi:MULTISPECIES: type II secretion system F family protein [Actinomyces]|uniref:type II secretion system F family protein n=1 Tax=Actinomyces TaxID=1654 RepID=UPI001359532C|nr:MULTISPECIES: type II secretion system F family protein [Actinomyces]
MSDHLVLGGLIGLLASLGILLVLQALSWRRPGLVARLEPYVRERPRGSALLRAPGPSGKTVPGLLLAAVAGLGGLLESMGSSADSVRQRLARSGSHLTYDELRVQQLVWAGAGLSAALGLGLISSFVRPISVPAVLIGALIAAIAGAAARDWWLSRSVKRRTARIEAQLPDVVELLALAVGAGQGPVDAIERVARRGRGDLVDELAMTLADIRSGTVLATALEDLEARCGCPALARLCEAITVAMERGTPLAEVLRSQAADSREAARRALIEEGGKREIAQMVPVVFLVLPITVLFALYPGIVVLRLGI